jgi:histidinol phosphatase-like PHP family hydrolase
MISLMPSDPAFAAPGRFLKGNIHTHSNRSDGAIDPADVCRRYREAGYDFLALTDHFLARYGFPIVDTRP